MNNLNIDQIIIDELRKIALDFPEIEKIILFGSRARSDNAIKSDIDLAINAPNISVRRWLDICEKIEELNTLLEIDIVNFKEANQELQNQIVKEGKIIYERQQNTTSNN